MLRALAIRLRALRLRAHRYLRQHPRVRRTLHAAGSMKNEPETIARGVGIGLFIGLTPTVGFQIVLMLAACFFLAGSFPMAFAASLVSNPFTMAPLYLGFHEVGERVFRVLPAVSNDSSVWFLQGLGDEFIFTIGGGLLVASPVAFIGYFLTSRSLALRARRRSAGKKRGQVD